MTVKNMNSKEIKHFGNHKNGKVVMFDRYESESGKDEICVVTDTTIYVWYFNNYKTTEDVSDDYVIINKKKYLEN